MCSSWLFITVTNLQTQTQTQVEVYQPHNIGWSMRCVLNAALNVKQVHILKKAIVSFVNVVCDLYLWDAFVLF